MVKKLILVTGGLGFIGKHFVQRCLDLGHFVTNIDNQNYAADQFANKLFEEKDNYRFLKADIANLNHLPECDILVNFAAESHVDNSISDSLQFCHSNILGVQRLLELARAKSAFGAPHFLQISTDEVYGDIQEGQHTELSPLKPSNPYSSTKAAADMLVIGWARTYGLKYNIVRLTNNYGSNQYPEKLIPKSAWRMRRGLPALIHGDGTYVRSWLHVEDSVNAILTVLELGDKNIVYNVHGSCELQNIDVVKKIASYLNIPLEKAFKIIPNRVGQDVRYSLDDSKLRALGWRPKKIFDDELRNIVMTDDFRRFL